MDSLKGFLSQWSPQYEPSGDKVVAGGGDLQSLPDDVLHLIFQHLSLTDCMRLKSTSRKLRHFASCRLGTTKICSLTLEVNNGDLRLWIVSQRRNDEFLEFSCGESTGRRIEAIRNAFTVLGQILSSCSCNTTDVWINMERALLPVNTPIIRILRFVHPLRCSFLYWPITGPIDFLSQIDINVQVEPYDPFPVAKKYRTKSAQQLLDEKLDHYVTHERI